MALAPADPVECLLPGVGGEDAEHDRDSGRQRGLLETPRGLPCDEVEVRRVAPDHRAEAHHPVARSRDGQVLGHQWELERAGNPRDDDVVVDHVAGPQLAPRAVEQLAGDVLVEPAHHDRDAHAPAVDRLGRRGVLPH